MYSSGSSAPGANSTEQGQAFVHSRPYSKGRIVRSVARKHSSFSRCWIQLPYRTATGRSKDRTALGRIGTDVCLESALTTQFQSSEDLAGIKRICPDMPQSI